MRTKDRKRQIKLYQKKLKIVNSEYRYLKRQYDDNTKTLETKIDVLQKNYHKMYEKLNAEERAIVGFAEFLKRTGNTEALKELSKQFNLDNVTWIKEE